MGLEQNNEQHYREVVDKFIDPVVSIQMTTSDYVVRPSASSAIVVTLPPVTDAKGRFYSIFARLASGANTITITHKDDSEGWTDIVLDAADEGVLLYSDGIRWITQNLADEISELYGITPGIVEASKAVVVDANKHQDVCLLPVSGLGIGATGAEVAVTASAAELNALTGATATAAEINRLAGVTAGTITADKAVTANASKDIVGVVMSKTVPFVEDATHTTHTGTVPIPAGATVHDIQVVNTVLWGAASAALDVGDSFDANGFFAAVDCKATDLAVGEVLNIQNSENWGGKNGAYLVAATGRKGNVQTGNSGNYYGVADSIIGVMTVGTPAVTTGRTFMTVTYSVGEVIAAIAA